MVEATHLAAITQLWGIILQETRLHLLAPQAAVLGSYTHLALAADVPQWLCRATSRSTTGLTTTGLGSSRMKRRTRLRRYYQEAL